MLAKELRYSDALHGGKAGSLVCSLLVEIDWSATGSKVPEAALCFVVSPSSFVSDGFSLCSSVSNAVWFSALIVGLEIGSHGWRSLDVSRFVSEESSTTPFASEELLSTITGCNLEEEQLLDLEW